MLSAVIEGVEAKLVSVEAKTEPSMVCSFVIVGVPEVAARELRVIVEMALNKAGEGMPVGKVVVTIAPPVRNTAGLDLPIALAILGLCGQNDLAYGSLSPTGDVYRVRGALVVERRESVLISRRIVIKNTRSLAALVSDLRQTPGSPDFSDPDLAMFDSATVSKFARAVYAGKSVLLVGPLGAGKTMLARRAVNMMGSLTATESDEIAAVHDVAGLNVEGQMDAGAKFRPFRAPHHSTSPQGMVGTITRPGEVSLAHHGVLFLDEVNEFSRVVMEMLARVMRDRAIVLTSAQPNVRLPAQCVVVATATPCPCGRSGDTCRCTTEQKDRHLDRVKSLFTADVTIDMPSLSMSAFGRV